MNYSYDTDQIVFIKDRDIVTKIDGTNTNSEAVLSNGIPSFDLLSGQVFQLSTQDDNLSAYIRDFVEISCNNLCNVVSALIRRDNEDVSYRGEVYLSDVYADPEHDGHTINSLYGLLLTNKDSMFEHGTGNRDRVMHKGFLFRSVAPDENKLGNFVITDSSEPQQSAILHDNDYILVTAKEGVKVGDIKITDV